MSGKHDDDGIPGLAIPSTAELLQAATQTVVDAARAVSTAAEVVQLRGTDVAGRVGMIDDPAMQPLPLTPAEAIDPSPITKEVQDLIRRVFAVAIAGAAAFGVGNLIDLATIQQELVVMAAAGIKVYLLGSAGIRAVIAHFRHQGTGPSLPTA